MSNFLSSPKQSTPKRGSLSSSKFSINNLVNITGTGKNGIARYIGSVSFASGTWVGVELPSAEGNSDGSRDGELYFSCKKNYGIFVKASSCTPHQDSNSKRSINSSSSNNSNTNTPIKLNSSTPTPTPTRYGTTGRSNATATATGTGNGNGKGDGNVSPMRSSMMQHKPNGTGTGTSISSGSASASNSDSNSNINFEMLLKRIENLEKKQNESCQHINTVLLLVQKIVDDTNTSGSSSTVSSGSGSGNVNMKQNDALLKVVEYARKAQNSLQ
jgi:hypothetical protein